MFRYKVPPKLLKRLSTRSKSVRRPNLTYHSCARRPEHQPAMRSSTYMQTTGREYRGDHVKAAFSGGVRNVAQVRGLKTRSQRSCLPAGSLKPRQPAHHR